MIRRLIFVGLMLILFFGCGYYEGVVQPTPQSYLAFMGNTRGAVAVIDQKITLNLEGELRDAEGRDRKVLFQITPGKHNVVVSRAGQEIVNRVIIVADGAIMEIQVP